MNSSTPLKLLDFEFDDEHLCEANPFPTETRLLHCVNNSGVDSNSWQLHCFRLASAAEVEMGEAEDLNELIAHNMLVVSYCPFCGEKLVDKDRT